MAGAYCDSQCILRELDRRFPEPGFAPDGHAGLAWSVSRCTDGELFTLAVKLVFGANADSLPEDFARDRGRLYLGPENDLHALTAEIPQIVAQLRGQLGWMDDSLSTGRPYVAGDAPGLVDALCYYLIWFLRDRWSGGPDFLVQFTHLTSWEERVRQIGHGRSTEIDAAEALEVARASTPQTPENGDPNDPLALEPGMWLAVTPEGDGGDPEVEGQLRFADRYSVALLRNDPHVDQVCTHFPRVGYRIRVL